DIIAQRDVFDRKKRRIGQELRAVPVAFDTGVITTVIGCSKRAISCADHLRGNFGIDTVDFNNFILNPEAVFDTGYHVENRIEVSRTVEVTNPKLIAVGTGTYYGEIPVTVGQRIDNTVGEFRERGTN